MSLLQKTLTLNPSPAPGRGGAEEAQSLQLTFTRGTGPTELQIGYGLAELDRSISFG
jgi:hypothetical protein